VSGVVERLVLSCAGARHSRGRRRSRGIVADIAFVVRGDDGGAHRTVATDVGSVDGHHPRPGRDGSSRVVVVVVIVGRCRGPGHGRVQKEEKEKVEKIQKGRWCQPQGGPFQQERQKGRQGVQVETLESPRQEGPPQKGGQEETLCRARRTQEEAPRRGRLLQRPSQGREGREGPQVRRQGCVQERTQHQGKTRGSQIRRVQEEQEVLRRAPRLGTPQEARWLRTQTRAQGGQEVQEGSQARRTPSRPQGQEGQTPSWQALQRAQGSQEGGGTRREVRSQEGLREKGRPRRAQKMEIQQKTIICS